MKIRHEFIGALVVAVFVAQVPSSRASAGFGNQSLTGAYGFSGTGTLIYGKVASNVEGLAVYDGNGHCTVKARLNAVGFVLPLNSSQCTYSVNADGTGTQTTTFTEEPHGPFVSDFVIADNTNEIRFILSDAAAGTNASGVSTKQGLSE